MDCLPDDPSYIWAWFVWLKFNTAQKRIGLTKYKYFLFTSLSENGFPRFKNTGIKKSPHTYITRRSKTIHTKASSFLTLSVFFGAITTPEFNYMYVVRTCNGHAGCNVMTPQCHVTIPLKLNMIFLDLPRLNEHRKQYSFGVSEVMYYIRG